MSTTKVAAVTIYFRAPRSMEFVLPARAEMVYMSPVTAIPPTRNEFADALDALGWSATRAAEYLGCSKSLISRYLSGAREPKRHWIRMLRDAAMEEERRRGEVVEAKADAGVLRDEGRPEHYPSGAERLIIATGAEHAGQKHPMRFAEPDVLSEEHAIAMMMRVRRELPEGKSDRVERLKEMRRVSQMLTAWLEIELGVAKEGE